MGCPKESSSAISSSAGLGHNGPPDGVVVLSAARPESNALGRSGNRPTQPTARVSETKSNKAFLLALRKLALYLVRRANVRYSCTGTAGASGRQELCSLERYLQRQLQNLHYNPYYVPPGEEYISSILYTRTAAEPPVRGFDRDRVLSPFILSN